LRAAHGGGYLARIRRCSANSVAVPVPTADFLREFVHKIRNSAALLVLPAAHIGGYSANPANDAATPAIIVSLALSFAFD